MALVSSRAGTDREGEQARGALLHDRDFRYLWAGETTSVLCREVGLLALPVVAVELLRATEFQVGALNAASMAAFLLVGLPAGAWVDRWRKRRTMIVADLVRMAAALVVPLLWFAGELQIWHLYVVAAVIGVGTVFFDVSYQSYLPFLVRSDQVPEANSRLEGTAQVARIAGPAVGGLMLKVISAPVLMLADAVGYLVSALCLRRIRDREVASEPDQHEPLVRAIAEGLRFVVRHPLIRQVTLCTSVGNVGATMVFTLLPILVLRRLGFEPWVMGLVFSVGALGGILGALLAARLGRLVGEGTLIPLSAALLGVSLLPVPMTVLAPDRLTAGMVLVAAEFLTSFGVLTYNVMQVSMRQRVCPPRLLGRMNASIRFLVWGGMPISSLAAGSLAGWIGLVPTLWIGAGITTVAMLPVLFSPLLGMRTLPTSPD